MTAMVTPVFFPWNEMESRGWSHIARKSWHSLMIAHATIFPSNLVKVLQNHDKYSKKILKIFSIFHPKASHQFFSNFFLPNNVQTNSCCSQHVMGQRSTCGGSGHSSPRKSMYIDAVDRHKRNDSRSDEEWESHTWCMSLNGWPQRRMMRDMVSKKPFTDNDATEGWFVAPKFLLMRGKQKKTIYSSILPKWVYTYAVKLRWKCSSWGLRSLWVTTLGESF